jgi:hypothetical protein
MDAVAPARIRRFSKYTLAILVVSTIRAMALPAVVLRHATISPLTTLLWMLALSLSITGWVWEDRRACGYKASFEFDAFVFFAWPVAVPYYLCRTRGWRGLYATAGLFAAIVGPLIVGALVAAWLSLP